MAAALAAGADARASDPIVAEQPSVTGIGGVFIRAQDPEAMTAWYEDNLGISRTPTSYDEEPWQQEAGPTVFGMFSHDTEYFGREEQQFMLNFRTGDLDVLVAHLRANGNEVTVDPETYPNGRFARVYDPDGNPVQLWEPAASSADEAANETGNMETPE
ncbi:MAG: VOC family protein [Sphingomonadaceae bacterium]|nr:VOC family protein [Sphingomonadaceae bacterium]